MSSNTWSGELGRLPAGDRDWLVANSVHVVVREPLWHVEEEGAPVSLVVCMPECSNTCVQPARILGPYAP